MMTFLFHVILAICAYCVQIEPKKQLMKKTPQIIYRGLD